MHTANVPCDTCISGSDYRTVTNISANSECLLLKYSHPLLDLRLVEGDGDEVSRGLLVATTPHHNLHPPLAIG